MSQLPTDVLDRLLPLCEWLVGSFCTHFIVLQLAHQYEFFRCNRSSLFICSLFSATFDSGVGRVGLLELLADLQFDLLEILVFLLLFLRILHSGAANSEFCAIKLRKSKNSEK